MLDAMDGWRQLLLALARVSLVRMLVSGGVVPAVIFGAVLLGALGPHVPSGHGDGKSGNFLVKPRGHWLEIDRQGARNRAAGQIGHPCTDPMVSPRTR
jgi:hypothetical protein